MQWLRLYHEIAHDPKVQVLPFEVQRHFIMLMCMTGEGHLTKQTTDEEVACYLRVSCNEVVTLRDLLQERFLIGNSWVLRAWEKRQRVSDDVAARVRKHRENKEKPKPKPKCNVTETAPDTDTDTDKKKEIVQISTNPPPFSEMVETWNELVSPYGISQVQRITDGRKQILRKRYVDDFESDPKQFERFVQRIVSSPFLTGDNDRTWRADFDWCLEPRNMTKIMEGKYDKKPPVAEKQNASRHQNSDKSATFDRSQIFGDMA